MTDLGREQLIRNACQPGRVGIDDLPTRIVKLADYDGLPVGHLLRIRAAELERELDITAPGWTAQKMVCAWERARLAWAQYTGEPLL